MPRNTSSKVVRSAARSGTAATTTVVVIVLAVGAFAGGYFLGHTMSAKKNYDRGHAAGWEEARKKVAESPALASRPDNTLASLHGTITAVGGSSFEIQTPPMQINPLDKESPATRTVMVNADTEILLLVEKTPEQLEADRRAFEEANEDFQAAVAAGEKPQGVPPPASASIEKKATLSDLKPGMMVEVTAAADVDLLYAESFTATSVKARMKQAASAPVEATLPPPAP